MLQAISDRGLLRERNEDAAAALTLPDGSLLLAVADGLGGLPGGEVASRTALDTLVERLQAQPTPDPAAGLREAFEEANRQVRAPRSTDRGRGWARRSSPRSCAARRPGLRTSATVAAYLVALDGAAIPALPQRLTEDHSWVEEQVRAGLLDPDDPLAALNRHVITRAIGLDERAGTDLYGAGSRCPTRACCCSAAMACTACSTTRPSAARSRGWSRSRAATTPTTRAA